MVIHQEAQTALTEILERVNKGFIGGEITKSDLVNWMLTHSRRFMTGANIKSLKNLHFDEKKVLSFLMKNEGKESELPEEINKAIREYYGISDRERKRDAEPVNKTIQDPFLGDAT